VFEYKDDFLMGPKTTIENGESGVQLCSASQAADEELSELAKMVGGDSANPKTKSADIPLLDEAPSLEFDLEGEISKAFETTETAVAVEEKPSVFDTSAIETAFTVPATSASGTGADFSDMIGDELDRALAEEVASDTVLGETSYEQSIDNYEQELSNLAGDGNSQSVSKQPAPPVPEATAQPWTVPQIMEAPALPAVLDIAAQDAAQIEFSPPKMEDFEIPAQDYSDPAADFGISAENVAAPIPEPEIAVGQQHIESVIGGAAALGIAAKTQQTKQPVVDPVAEFEAGNSGEISTAFDDDTISIPPPHVFDSPANSGRSGRRAAVAVVAVALFSGAAVFGWNAMGGKSGPAPTILASSEPVKIKPKETGGEVVPNQDLAVFKSVEGGQDSASKQLRLKDKTEKPIVVAAKTPVRKIDTRIEGADRSTTGGLIVKPRLVRTVVVKPDGTIIRTSAPKSEASTSKVEIAEPTLALNTEIVKIKAATQEQPTAVQKTTETPIEIAKLEPTPVKLKPVVAEPVKKVVETPAVEPVAKAASSVPSPFAVQISSQRSSAAAEQSYKTLSRRYASVIGGKGVDIQKAVVKGKGTYYRVRIPAPSIVEANKICSSLKARGGACFVTR